MASRLLHPQNSDYDTQVSMVDDRDIFSPYFLLLTWLLRLEPNPLSFHLLYCLIFINFNDFLPLPLLTMCTIIIPYSVKHRSPPMLCPRPFCHPHGPSCVPSSLRAPTSLTDISLTCAPSTIQLPYTHSVLSSARALYYLFLPSSSSDLSSPCALSSQLVHHYLFLSLSTPCIILTLHSLPPPDL